MENVLILGAAGNIGYDLLLKLIEKEYILTAFDINTNINNKKLNKLKDKTNIVYGDIEDKTLIKELVKNKDIIINCAGIMPPYANLDDEIANTINYKGNKNVVDAIREFNPQCKYFYLSFISVYGITDKEREINLKTEIDDHNDLYTKSIIKSEEYIKTNLKKHCILRMPIVLTADNYYINHLKLSRKTDFITINDLNNLIIDILKKKEINKKTYNISGFKVNSTDIITDIYIVTGELKIAGRDIYYGLYTDDNEIEELTSNKKTTYKSYIKELKEKTPKSKRKIRKTLNYFKYLILQKRAEKE